MPGRARDALVLRGPKHRLLRRFLRESIRRISATVQGAICRIRIWFLVSRLQGGRPVLGLRIPPHPPLKVDRLDSPNPAVAASVLTSTSLSSSSHLRAILAASYGVVCASAVPRHILRPSKLPHPGQSFQGAAGREAGRGSWTGANLGELSLSSPRTGCKAHAPRSRQPAVASPFFGRSAGSHPLWSQQSLLAVVLPFCAGCSPPLAGAAMPRRASLNAPMTDRAGRLCHVPVQSNLSAPFGPQSNQRNPGKASEPSTCQECLGHTKMSWSAVGHRLTYTTNDLAYI